MNWRVHSKSRITVTITEPERKPLLQFARASPASRASFCYSALAMPVCVSLLIVAQFVVPIKVGPSVGVEARYCLQGSKSFSRVERSRNQRIHHRKIANLPKHLNHCCHQQWICNCKVWHSGFRFPIQSVLQFLDKAPPEVPAGIHLVRVADTRYSTAVHSNRSSANPNCSADEFLPFQIVRFAGRR